MFPLIVSEMDDGYLWGEFSRFDCHGVVCVFNNESMWGLVISFSVQNPEKDKSAKDKFNHTGGSMWRLKKNTPWEH